MAWIKYPPRILTWHIERDQWYFQLGRFVLLSADKMTRPPAGAR